MNTKVDAYFDRATKWKPELQALRKIALTLPLTEDLKWGQPCYMLDGANVFIIHAFKEYCALLFFKGALLKDPKKLLIRQTENVNSSRQIRFGDVPQITKLKATIKAYLEEAIEVEKSGQKVPPRPTKDYPVPAELTARFKSDPALKTAFKALTHGRQRAYLLHFAGAKQAKTREARIEKYAKQILKGRGMDD